MRFTGIIRLLGFNTFIFSLFFILFVQQSLFSATIIIHSSNGGKAIQEAINKAHAYDRIIIRKGTYFVQGLVIDKPLVIIGKDLPVIDGSNKRDVILITSDHVTISGIIVQNSGRSSVKDYAGIKMLNVRFCNVERCHLLNNYFAFHIDKSQRCNILYNYINGHAVSESSSGNGIHLWKCDSFNIAFNNIEYHRDGIYFEFVKGSRILHNLSRHNLRYGLHFMFSDNDAYEYNEFEDNGAGVAVMYTNHILMRGNTFHKNWGPSSYGLLLKDINYSSIVNNYFIQNTVGIQMEGSNKLHIRRNCFSRNGWAMRIMGNCENDTIQLNNFTGNSFDVGTNSSATGNLNIFTNNYWDKYKGYDLDHNHIGDIAYHPVSVFSMFVEDVPYAVVLLHSFLIEILDEVEKSLPSLIPVTLEDPKPMMKQIAISTIE